MGMFARLYQPEIGLFGFYLPWLLIMIVLGFITAWGLTLLLERWRVTQHVWHLPLFFFGLCILMTSLWGLVFAP